VGSRSGVVSRCSVVDRFVMRFFGTRVDDVGRGLEGFGEDLAYRS
jgi:hypothetical protein